jgi:hypothetical protein
MHPDSVRVLVSMLFLTKPFASHEDAFFLDKCRFAFSQRAHLGVNRVVLLPALFGAEALK